VSPAPSPELIKAALNHDVPEIVTGDIPATFKWGNDILVAMLDNVEKAFHKRVGTEWGELSKEEQHILKWCDTMELVLWCIEEKQMGNSAIGPVLDNGFMYLGRLGHPTERAFNLFNYIAESMEP
jgi:5'-deoxynucleotidase YfbR-like HD superfamily hydrolase